MRKVLMLVGGATVFTQLTKATLSGAAENVRNAHVLLDRIAGQLESHRVWSGDDAEKFRREWADDISHPLVVAAALLEGVSYTTMR